jgi:hypothetical protein
MELPKGWWLLLEADRIPFGWLPEGVVDNPVIEFAVAVFIHLLFPKHFMRKKIPAKDDSGIPRTAILANQQPKFVGAEPIGESIKIGVIFGLQNFTFSIKPPYIGPPIKVLIGLAALFAATLVIRGPLIHAAIAISVDLSSSDHAPHIGVYVIGPTVFVMIQDILVTS